MVYRKNITATLNAKEYLIMGML